MAKAHNLGFPRIGARRELKWALENYWQGTTTRAELLETARELRTRHWQWQKEAGLESVPVGDFSLYDHVLDHSVMLGAVPERFGPTGETVDLDTMFRMGRGRAPTGEPAAACEMTKWFDTNYHYIVPELHAGQRFHLASTHLFDAVDEARAAGMQPRPVLLGPLTWLWLGKIKGADFDRLELLDGLVAVYGEILAGLRGRGVEWVQVDEPILVQDLPRDWQQAFESTYSRLAGDRPRLLLATYFGPLADNLKLACDLPVDGLHVDAVRHPEQLQPVADWLPGRKVLSAGIVDGRNVWRTDLDACLAALAPLHERRGDDLWLAPSCSLLHVPVDIDPEDGLDDELKGWLAFARQKLDELALLETALNAGPAAVAGELAASRAAIASRRASERLHRPAVRGRVAAVDAAMGERDHAYPERRERQREVLDLPLFPTTTIGSFPQTRAIRASRRDYRAGRIDRATYEAAMREHIEEAVERQEACGLDVLVHGEPERNDMVEYFGQQLDGFAFTRQGWVQSYGSRCVKPPIIFGDVSRPAPMTVDWFRFARSLSDKPVKGMLTGPVTLLNWSFVRDDQPRADTCLQLALAIREEVLDLERAGARIIQIDEAALREGLPLRRSEWQGYLDWAVRAFRVTANGVDDATQVHTHMCYSEFNDIIESIAAMDADVITIETSRSDMELLDVFEDFEYPNEIGPGVYDIHSPNIPTVAQMVALMEKAAAHIPAERLWVNPDCGLKTRGWPEVEAALANMVTAARELRARRA